MKIGIIVQARMNSRRLPGKVLMPLLGKPMLLYTLERLRQTGLPLWVATSDRSHDDAVADFCMHHQAACFRGDEEDVAGRFVRLLEQHPLDAFVRISGDSPLLDPRLVEIALSHYRKDRPDLVTNVFPRSYPPGQSVEVLDSERFRAAYLQMTDPLDREHVTRLHYRLPEQFAIRNFNAALDYSHLHWAVDTAEDFARVEAMLTRMTRPHVEYGFEALLALCHPRAIQAQG
jgi:spore coat polysaccharide biosynthesis protein SpsF